MQKDAVQLPDDIERLKEYALNQIVLRKIAEEEKASLLEQQAHLVEQQHCLEKENTYYKTKVLTLEERINILLHNRFGSSSEKYSPDQILLFNEAEFTEDLDSEAIEVLADTEVITVPAHVRKKPGRKPLPKNLPRIQVIHDLCDEEKICPHDGHALQEMNRITSEQLDIIPAKIRVIEHVRIQYSCPCCDQGIKLAPLPAQPIPKSIASPGLLAHITVSKYEDGLPLYRQEKQFKRLGIELNRNSMANWMIKAGREVVQPLINLMQDRLLESDYLHMDETTVQVLKEPGKTAISKSYMWVRRCGPPQHPVVLYDYEVSRSGSVPERLLAGFRGYLQSDGYEGYNAICKQDGITQVGCWAHARRKFDEAIKAQGKKGKTKGSKATKGLNYIGKLYAIEQAYKDKTDEQRYLGRQEKAKPVLKEIKTWLDQSLNQINPKSATGRALNYLNNQWGKLICYTENGKLRIDNNLVENAIRPFAIGRKNWLFCDTQKGAKASANLYSLIETAKANDLEPYHYLRTIFTALPKANTVEDIEALLPYNIDPEKLKI